MRKYLTSIISILIIAILLEIIIFSRFYKLQVNGQSELAQLVNEKKIEAEQKIEIQEREKNVEQAIEQLKKEIEEENNLNLK